MFGDDDNILDIEGKNPTEEIKPEPAGDYQPTDEDLANFGIWAAEQDRKQFEQRPPMPEDYGITETEDIAEEIPVQQTQPQPQAVEVATTEPQVNTATGSFAGTLFDMDNPDILKTRTPEPVINIQQEPLITLYDLFGFSQEERSQINRPRRP